MSMRIASVYFSIGRRFGASDDRYPRMARVLEYSARANSPNWDVSIEAITAELAPMNAHKPGRNGLATNTDKLRAWCRIVERAPDGELLALLDADTMVLRSLDAVNAYHFDVALTEKRQARAQRLPLNGGVVFLRINDRSRAFMARWLEVNERLYHDPVEHAHWRNRYGGMNQASLGLMLETPGAMPLVEIKWLQCAEWNCCDEILWQTFDAARIVHVKSGLRRAIFAPSNYGRMRALRDIWYQYERRANENLPQTHALG